MALNVLSNFTVSFSLVEENSEILMETNIIQNQSLVVAIGPSVLDENNHLQKAEKNNKQEPHGNSGHEKGLKRNLGKNDDGKTDTPGKNLVHSLDPYGGVYMGESDDRRSEAETLNEKQNCGIHPKENGGFQKLEERKSPSYQRSKGSKVNLPSLEQTQKRKNERGDGIGKTTKQATSVMN